ncbi:hypothetical protein OG285_18640 [Streptomyces sp. NBC_01471]|uniref:hypothetical protein n=1 Tax=Streptomyces sp. NBC_01471 TaxID=2903879 RepID=UPI003243EFCA
MTVSRLRLLGTQREPQALQGKGFVPAVTELPVDRGGPSVEVGGLGMPVQLPVRGARAVPGER